MNEVYRDIDQHMTHLRRYAGALTGNPVTADDLVQDAIVNALSKSHLYRPGTNLRAWLCTILRNQHFTNLRRAARFGSPVDPDDVAAPLATPPAQEDALGVEAVHQALRSLPEGQRKLIELVAVDDQSYEDIAKRHGLALGTVKSRISRGRSHLRKVLEGQVAIDRPVPCAPANDARPPVAGDQGEDGQVVSCRPASAHLMGSGHKMLAA